MLGRERITRLLTLGRGEIVRGEPYDAGGRRLTPIARVRRHAAANGRFEIFAVDPIGVLEEVDGRRHLIPLGGGWSRRIGILALLTLPIVAFVVASAIARAARRSGRARNRR